MQASRKLTAGVLLLAMLTVGCDHAPDSHAGPIVDIGATQYRVPMEYLHPEVDRLTLEMSEATLPAFPLLRIPIDTEPTAGEVIDESDTFSITVAGESTPAGSAASRVHQRAADAWMQQGIYADRIVKHDVPARLYRIYSRVEFPSRWHYFTAKPSGDSLTTEWVAECWVPDGTAVAEGFGNVTCQSSTSISKALVEITFSGTRIACRNSIAERARELLTKWTVRT